MGYKVDFDSLDAFQSSVNQQITTWNEELAAVTKAVTAIQGSSHMSGQGADNIKLYFENVHGIVSSLLVQLLSSIQNNCFLYKRDYFTNIDTDLHTVIKENELNDISSSIDTNRLSAIDVDGAISDALRKIKDIFYVQYKDVSVVDAAHTSVCDFLKDLDQSIQDLEDRHNKNDFDDTGKLISALTVFLNEQIKHPRSYKTDFSIEKLSGSESFRELYNAYICVTSEQQDQAVLLNTEIENEKQRVADLQAEIEERQKKAKVFKWIVTGVCIIGSIAVMAATGGAATPLVVGAVSAVSGAISAGASNLADQYVQHGNLIENADDIDWGSMGKDMVVAGVSGFVTGAVGAGVGGAITSKLSSTALGNTLLHSSSSFVRIGTGAVIGSVSEIGSGIVSRGATTLITSGGDVGEALDAAIDGKQIVSDAVTGGVSGGFEQYSYEKRAQKVANEKASSYNESRDPYGSAQEKGLTGVNKTENNGVEFSESDHILRTEANEPVEVKIKATGNREADFKQAEKIAKEKYGLDLQDMRKGEDATHVWHHVDDYNPATNETTLQFIEIKAHDATKPHSGSVAQYQAVHGEGYALSQAKQHDSVHGYDIGDELSELNETHSSIQSSTQAAKESYPQGYETLDKAENAQRRLWRQFDRMGMIREEDRLHDPDRGAIYV